MPAETAIEIPFQSDSSEFGGGNNGNRGGERKFTRRHGVLLIAFLETVGSIITISIYSHALIMQPDWFPILLPFSNDPSAEAAILPGVMYIIVLTSTMELFLALYLFYGVKRENLGRVRFWLNSMLTYVVLVTIVVFGVGLGGIYFPRLDFAASINVFVRFLEITVVNTWLEQRKMERNFARARKMELEGRCGSRRQKNLRIYNKMVPNNMRKVMPPGCDCNFPSCTVDHAPSHDLPPITEEQ